MPSLSNHPSAWEPDEWDDADWAFDLDDEIWVDPAVACSLENPESCESCT